MPPVGFVEQSLDFYEGEKWTCWLGSVRHSSPPDLHSPVQIYEAESKAMTFMCILSFRFHNRPLKRGRHDYSLHFPDEKIQAEGRNHVAAVT